MHQVIIVGAGPAGAYLAYLLSRAGISVLVLEKKRFPRYKPCGGGITPKAVKLLDFDLNPVIEDTVRSAVFTYQLKNPVTVNFEEPIIYMVSRERFDALLLEKARESGSKIIEGTRVERVEVSERRVTVYTDGKDYHGELLAGADGALGVVARSLGLCRHRRIAPSLECEFPASAEIIKDSRGNVKIDYGLIHEGYTWIFPKENHLSVGVWSNSARPRNLRSSLKKLFQAEELGGTPHAAKTRGWFIPVNPKPVDLHGKRSLVVGDAAGLADAFTGEGIYSALFSARLAAEVITGQSARQIPDLRQYTSLVQEKMGPDLAGSHRLSRWVPHLSGLIHNVLYRHQDLVGEFMEVASGGKTYAGFLKLFQKKVRGLLRSV